MTFPTTVINGHTYTDTVYQADRDATMALIAADVAAVAAGITSVGLKIKPLSDANTTLTSPESTGLVFVFTGALTAARTVNFVSGFLGTAIVVNKTTGGFKLTMGVAGGPTGTVDCPASGSVIIACDGSTTIHILKTAATSTGAQAVGTLAAGPTTITGAATISSTLGLTGALTAASTGAFSGNVNIGGTLGTTGAISSGAGLNAAGNSVINGNQTVGGTLGVTGAATFNSTVVTAGNVTISGEISVDRVNIGGPNFFLYVDGSSHPTINYSANNYEVFDGSSWTWVLASTAVGVIDVTGPHT